MSLPWDKQRVTEDTEVQEVAEKFILANCYDPAVPGIRIMSCSATLITAGLSLLLWQRKTSNFSIAYSSTPAIFANALA
ncbi:hypothetical protein [Nostoc sp.]|uniref:hypothetical protein n=1 Tax=Nostoc sp. TaxID=1180 RepID=UPI002FFB5A9F